MHSPYLGNFFCFRRQYTTKNKNIINQNVKQSEPEFEMQIEVKINYKFDHLFIQYICK